MHNPPTGEADHSKPPQSNTPWIQNPVNPNLWITTFDHQFDDEPVWSEGLVLKDGGSRDVHEGVGFERVATPERRFSAELEEQVRGRGWCVTGWLADTDQTEERIGAPELTDSNGVGCAMRPRPAKDEDVRPEDPEQVGGVRNGVKLIGLEHRGDEGRQSRAATTTEWSTIITIRAAPRMRCPSNWVARAKDDHRDEAATDDQQLHGRAPKAHLSPRQHIANKGGENTQEQEEHTQTPHEHAPCMSHR